MHGLDVPIYSTSDSSFSIVLDPVYLRLARVRSFILSMYVDSSAVK